MKYMTLKKKIKKLFAYDFDQVSLTFGAEVVFSGNVSNVKNMRAMLMFSKFNSDISKWDVSNVKWMDYMFADSGFNKDISKWKTTSIEVYTHIFTECPLENKPEYQPKFKI